MITLPPKRFEDDSDPRFDSIRHLPWFSGLAERRAKIPLLDVARLLYRTYQSKCRNPQAKAAAELGVDERELRDYVSFFYGTRPKPDRTTQRILDDAYSDYCRNSGKKPLRSCIIDCAFLYGRAARPIIEEWEINPSFYPSVVTVYQPVPNRDKSNARSETIKNGQAQ